MYLGHGGSGHSRVLGLGLWAWRILGPRDSGIGAGALALVRFTSVPALLRGKNVVHAGHMKNSY